MNKEDFESLKRGMKQANAMTKTHDYGAALKPFNMGFPDGRNGNTFTLNRDQVDAVNHALTVCARLPGVIKGMKREPDLREARHDYTVGNDDGYNAALDAVLEAINKMGKNDE